MKKVIGIALVLALAVMLMPSAVFADDPTEVDITWGGGTYDAGGYPVDFGVGHISATVTAGADATTTFSTGADQIQGQFWAQDSNDASTLYGIDAFTTNLKASVTDVTSGLGSITYETTRLGSYVPSYGAPGQYSSSYVGVQDGTGYLANQSWTNYAQMRDYNYSFNGAGQVPNIGATNAALYEIDRYIEGSTGDYGEVYALGSGSAHLNCVGSEIGSGTKSYSQTGLGTLCNYPSPRPAGFSATGGSGFFQVLAGGHNSVTTQGSLANMTGSTGGGMTWGSPGAAANFAYGSGYAFTGDASLNSAWFNLTSTFGGSFAHTDYATNAK